MVVGRYFYGSGARHLAQNSGFKSRPPCSVKLSVQGIWLHLGQRYLVVTTRMRELKNKTLSAARTGITGMGTVTAKKSYQGNPQKTARRGKCQGGCDKKCFSSPGLKFFRRILLAHDSLGNALATSVGRTRAFHNCFKHLVLPPRMPPSTRLRFHIYGKAILA